MPPPGDGVDDLAALDDLHGHQAPLADARLTVGIAGDVQGVCDSGVPDALREQARTGIMVTVAGIVINRQHPPTARGYTFLSLDDETGLVNVIIRPSLFTRYQRAILDSPVIMVVGELQDEHGAAQFMAHTCQPATSDRLGAPPSRDWS